jgi:hypothetical protein
MDIEFILLSVFLIVIIVGLVAYIVYENIGKKRHHHKKVVVIGGCKGTRYGCCSDGMTPKLDPFGSNCVDGHHHHHHHKKSRGDDTITWSW